MTLPLQRALVYGPVRSRRLGRSLGINVLPAGGKVCTFDCRYCQYGWTNPAVRDGGTPAATFPAVADVLDAVDRALAALPDPPAYLTFSGHGEATLHPRFADLVDGVRAIRDRRAPAARTAILSNSSTVGDPRVRAALGRLDLRVMKLDAGTEATFRRFNGPAAGLTLDAVVAGLGALEDVTLQALFAGGPTGNLVPGEVEAWLARVRAVRPSAVQVYTLDRGGPCEGLLPAEAAQLAAVCARVREIGVAAAAF